MIFRTGRWMVDSSWSITGGLSRHKLSFTLLLAPFCPPVLEPHLWEISKITNRTANAPPLSLCLRVCTRVYGCMEWNLPQHALLSGPPFPQVAPSSRHLDNGFFGTYFPEIRAVPPRRWCDVFACAWQEGDKRIQEVHLRSVQLPQVRQEIQSRQQLLRRTHTGTGRWVVPLKKRRKVKTLRLNTTYTLLNKHCYRPTKICTLVGKCSIIGFNPTTRRAVKRGNSFSQHYVTRVSLSVYSVGLSKTFCRPISIRILEIYSHFVYSIWIKMNKMNGAHFVAEPFDIFVYDSHPLTARYRVLAIKILMV